MTDSETIKELELQIKVKDGIIETFQEIIGKQFNIIKELGNQIDKITPDTIA